MSRRNLLLLAVLVLQLGLIAFFYRPRAEVASQAASFFEGLTPESVHELTITDDKGTSFTLRKAEAGWVLPAVEDYPADRDKVRNLLEKILDLRAERLVTRTVSSQQRLKVADEAFNRKLVLTLGPGEETRTVFLGSSPNYKTIHVRVKGRDEVYLAKDLFAWEAGVEPSSWWNDLYFEAKEEDLTRVTLTNGKGGFSLARDEKGEWAFAGEKEEPATAVSAKALSDFWGSVGALRMNKPLGREEKKSYGLESPAARLTLVTKSGETSLAVGAMVEEGDDRVVKSSSSPFYAQIPGYAVADLLERQHADLLEKEEAKDTPGEGDESFRPPDGESK